MYSKKSLTNDIRFAFHSLVTGGFDSRNQIREKAGVSKNPSTTSAVPADDTQGQTDSNTGCNVEVVNLDPVATGVNTENTSSLAAGIHQVSMKDGDGIG